MANRIDDAFIGEWHPRYDVTEHDEAEYQRLVAQVADEIRSGVTMSRGTCERIYKWKAARAIGRVAWPIYDDVYLPRLRKALAAQRELKLDFLVDHLPGLQAPTASTLLHFMQPDLMPIIDRRTVAVLFAAKLVQVNSTASKNYGAFCAAIDGIRRRCPGWTLREIDRALFAYDKQSVTDCIS